MTISYKDPFHFRADESTPRRRRNLDESPELRPIPPARNPADPFPDPRPWLPQDRDDSPKLPAPALPLPQIPPVLPPGNPFPDPDPSPKLQFPRPPDFAPPIYVDPPSGGLLGLLQTMIQQPDVEPDPGAPASRPDGDGAVSGGLLRRPTSPPQDQYEADLAQQAREAAAVQLARGVRRLARINPEPPDADGSVNGFLRAYANGVPIVGGFNNKIEAGLAASLAPVLNPLVDSKEQLNEPTWKGRYENALGRQNAFDARFAKEHPRAAALADFAGGISAIGALRKTALGARMLGLTDGPLGEMMLRGATTRAAVTGADAAVRGEPEARKFASSTVLGAAGPIVSRTLGKLPIIRNLGRLP